MFTPTPTPPTPPPAVVGQAADVNVSFTTSDGTAVAGVDYDAASGMVTIPRGQTSKAINLTWACDAAWQPKANRTVIVTLSSPSPTVPMGAPAATLTIQEDTAVRPRLPAVSSAWMLPLRLPQTRQKPQGRRPDQTNTQRRPSHPHPSSARRQPPILSIKSAAFKERAAGCSGGKSSGALVVELSSAAVRPNRLRVGRPVGPGGCRHLTLMLWRACSPCGLHSIAAS
jgi:hypothetical protein